MKLLQILLPISTLLFLVACSQVKPDSDSDPDFKQLPQRPMELTAPAFANNGKIPSKFTCDGENINPALSFDDVPAQAQSLVLIMDDPDVPKSIREDGMWDHWVVFNIPPHTQGVNENGQPDGVAGSNTRGDLSYGGPCPPDREHRYFFKLYALDSELDLPEGSTKAEVEEGMRDHIIGEAELVGLYKRISE